MKSSWPADAAAPAPDDGPPRRHASPGLHVCHRGDHIPLRLADGPADNGSSPSGESLALNEHEWFREIRRDGWEAWGGEPVVLNAVLQRIKNATGERENPEWLDTMIAPGAGNWVTERSAAGRWARRGADTAHARHDTSAVRSRSLGASLSYPPAAYPEHGKSAPEKGPGFIENLPPMTRRLSPHGMAPLPRTPSRGQGALPAAAGAGRGGAVLVRTKAASHHRAVHAR